MITSSRLVVSSLAAVAALLLNVPESRAATADELIKAGDVFDRKYQSKQALEHYLAAEKLQPKSAPLLVRIARQYRHLMTDATAREEKLRLGRTALVYSQRAAAAAPNDPEAHLSVAISYGKILPILGKKEQTESSPKIKAAAERALKLDPNNDLTWHVLGKWNRVLADVSAVKRAIAPLIYGKLPAGSNEEAVRQLQRAIKLNPNRPMHYIELGRAYAQMGKTAEARQALTKGLSMPNTEKDDPETKRFGREALAKLR